MALSQPTCDEYLRLTRRTLLAGGVATAGSLLLPRSLRAAPMLASGSGGEGARGDVLLCVFLRGGADACNMVVPYLEDNYYKLRPSLAVGRPDDSNAEIRAIDLDGFFGLHPSLSDLLPIWDAGNLAFVHATGSPDQTRSHFAAMDLMERGAIDGLLSGWLARHLGSHDTGNSSTLRAISASAYPSLALSGSRSIAVNNLAAYELKVNAGRKQEIRGLIETLHAGGDRVLAAESKAAFSTIDLLSGIDPDSYKEEGRLYTDTFGAGLRMIAQLIKSEVGVEVAYLNLDGWDTHAEQGLATGVHPSLMSILAGNLLAFFEDMKDEWHNLTVVVMTEFGRRLKQNGSLGTDHGHGTLMLVLGGGILGRKVYTSWPGLADDQLVGPGDLAITVDYRDVLAEILRKRLLNQNLSQVFPGYSVDELGLALDRV